MRNFHNLVSDVLDNYELEGLSVHVNYVEEDDEYHVDLNHPRFTARFRAIQEEFPMVSFVYFHHSGDDSFYSGDLDFLSYIQSDLIDEMYEDM